MSAERISDMQRNGLTETILMSLINDLGMYLMLSDMENVKAVTGKGEQKAHAHRNRMGWLILTKAEW